MTKRDLFCVNSVVSLSFALIGGVVLGLICYHIFSRIVTHFSLSSLAFKQLKIQLFHNAFRLLLLIENIDIENFILKDCAKKKMYSSLL